MTNDGIKRIVDAVIQNDLAPPSAEYSTHDYGNNIARSLTPDGAALLVSACLKSLPGSLAATFLDGVLESIEVPQLEHVLLTSLSHTSEVSSAGPIVDWLIAHCDLGPGDIAKKMLYAIHNTTDAQAQNTHAYALWILSGLKNDCSVVRKIGD